MEHQDFNHVVFATLEGLVVHSSKESIFITTPLTESINCRSGLFQVDTRTAFFSVGYLNNEAEEGSINLNVTGGNGCITLKAEDGVYFGLAKIGAALHGPGGARPAYMYLKEDLLVLGKGNTIDGPLLGGMISLQDDSVVIKAGSSKINVTPTGVVIEIGETKFELSVAGIKLTAGPVSSLNVGVGEIDMKCGEAQFTLNAIEAEIKAVVTKIKAEAKAAIEGTLAELKAKAINDLKAALQNI